jgi:SAM-dependent methyltransferase
MHLVDAWRFVAYDWQNPGRHVPSNQSLAFVRYLKSAAPEWKTDDPNDGLEILYQRVLRRFEDDSRIRVARGLSYEVLATYPDEYFDFIYIDADHDFHPVLSDLWEAKRILKKGGLILGHDFDMDRSNGWSNHNVIEGVLSFCKHSGFRVIALSADLGSTYVLGEFPFSPFASNFLRRLISLRAQVIEIPQEIVWNYRRTIVRIVGGATLISSFCA